MVARRQVIPILRIKIRGGWRAALAVLLCGSWAWASDPAVPRFVSQPQTFPGLRNGSLAWADFDNDGDLDLFACGDAMVDSLSRVYRNDNGAFVDTRIVLPAYRSSSASWADFDKDGFLDLVLTGLSDYDVPGSRVFRNVGGSNLVEAFLLPDFDDGTAAWGDFNQDGYPDLAIGGENFDRTSRLGRVFVNQQGTNFTQFAVLSGGEGSHERLDWADYDHDGRLDLLGTGEGGGARIYRNEGNRFTLATNAVITSSAIGQWLDANNDGWPDLLILAHWMTNSFVLLNNRAGGFTNGSVLGTLGAHAVGDINNDGWSDVVIAGYRYSRERGHFVYELSGVYFNSGTNTWLEHTSLVPNLGGACVAWGDYDRDGRLDLVMHGQADGNHWPRYLTFLYRNVITRTNEPPAAPTGLRATMEPASVVLSWDAATDANQNGGLTYNVRVGSRPGQSDIVNPMSAPDGWRRVVEVGNADGRTFYALRGLQPHQEYYWSVQAIDNSYSGSSFASEAAFTFNRLPVARSQNVSLDEDTSQVISLRGSDADGDILSFTVLAGPTNGFLTGNASNLIEYTPKPNFHGPDHFSFRVSAGGADSHPGSVSIWVSRVNDAPVADATNTRTVWISGNGTDAMVTLDGSRSFDIDSANLKYSWLIAGSNVATEAVAVAPLPVGTNFVELVVTDGLASDTNSITVRVITAVDALQALVAMTEAEVARPRPLISILSTALTSIERGRTHSGINQLRAFQNQVRAQLAGHDSTLADELAEAAQAVIDANADMPSSQTRESRLRKRLIQNGKGGTRIEFEAAAGGKHVIEASSDLRNWRAIGDAVERAPGLFDFEDSSSESFSNRFYRVVTP